MDDRALVLVMLLVGSILTLAIGGFLIFGEEEPIYSVLGVIFTFTGAYGVITTLSALLRG